MKNAELNALEDSLRATLGLPAIVRGETVENEDVPADMPMTRQAEAHVKMIADFARKVSTESEVKSLEKVMRERLESERKVRVSGVAFMGTSVK